MPSTARRVHAWQSQPLLGPSQPHPTLTTPMTRTHTDTHTYLAPHSAWPPAGAAPASFRQESMGTPRTGSFVHLHLGIDAAGLPDDLEMHHLVANQWSDFEVCVG